MRKSLLPFRTGRKFVYAFVLLLLFFGFIPAASAQMDFNVILQQIESEPVEGQLAYQVHAYLSVVDGEGVPVKELKQNNFTILEDSLPVEFTVEPAPQRPISLALVMDASGSMAGQGILRAKDASQKLVGRLSPEDNIAILTFGSKVTVMNDFTTNRSQAMKSIDDLQLNPQNAWSCIYDAVYKATQMISALPEGRRAIVLLTDGKDVTLNGSPCSSATVDDIIRAASITSATPIYVVGVGKDIDTNALERIATMTGGNFLNSSDFSQLDGMFDSLYEQLTYQYMVSYISKASPGSHTLTTQVNIGRVKDQDTRPFLFSDLPPVISFRAPTNGQNIDSLTTISLTIGGQAQSVDHVTYEFNDKEAGVVADPPFDFKIDPTQYDPGTMKIVARAYDSGGAVLSTTNITVNLTAPRPTATLDENAAKPKETETPLPAVTATAAPAMISIGGNNLWLYGGIGGGVLLVAVIGTVLLARRRKTPAGTASTAGGGGDTTMDGETGLAVLTVLFSDDPSDVGRRIKMNKPSFRLGRSPENDAVFAGDHPVSRRHALIEFRDGEFTLSEVLSYAEGNLKAPPFGTFVNGDRLSGSGVVLHSGDEIRLGSRLKLRFESLQATTNSATMDDMTQDGATDNTVE